MRSSGSTNASFSNLIKSVSMKTLVRFPNSLKGSIACLLCLAIFHAAPLSARCKSRNKRITVRASVIGIEVPESPWAGEFQSVKILYLKIQRVLKGHEDAKYIRVAYGYNPSSGPENILPEEMFDGKSAWEFHLSRSDTFDGKLEVSRRQGDWLDEANRHEDGNNFLIPVKPKCVPTSGHQPEALLLEQMQAVKGYWLDWKNFKKAPRS
jgi:hypothetical protein